MSQRTLSDGLIRCDEEGPGGPTAKASPGATGNVIDNLTAHTAGWYKPFVKPLPAPWGMLNDEKLQLAGPVVVISAVAAAEFGAHALAYWPSSSLLWYLNLEVLRPIQYSVVAEQGLVLGDFAQILCVVVPLLALVCIGLITKARFPLALASNLSLLYSALLLYGSYLTNDPIAGTGARLSALWGPSFFLAVSVLLTSCLSSAISHRAYWRELVS
jgi:hypothetical protein